MRTIQRTVYTAAELREHCPHGFERALQRHCRWIENDPPWAAEYRRSLAAALAAIGTDPPDIEGTRRVMAWLENHVLEPLRIGWKGPYRRKVAQYGASYRPGCVKPGPWTGFHVDDALLDEMRDLARDGRNPREWRRAIEDRADYLWQEDIASRCTADYFVEEADATEREYYDDGGEA